MQSSREIGTGCMVAYMMTITFNQSVLMARGDVLAIVFKCSNENLISRFPEAFVVAD